MSEDSPWYDVEVSWQARLAGWLTVDEWSRHTAAYLLVGLDPEGTHGPCDEHGLSADWLTHHGKDALPTDEVASEHELSMLLRRALDETQRADRSKVVSPSEWLKWSARVRLEPPWLKAAIGDERLVLLLPDFPPHHGLAKEAGLLREAARAGGKRRHERSDAGRANKILAPLILRWLNDPSDITAKAFAERLQDELGKSDPGLKVQRPWAEIATIEGWIRGERRQLAARRASAG